VPQLATRDDEREEDDGGTDWALTTDQVFMLLKNRRRRHAIKALRRLGGESTVRELTAEVAAMENGVPPEQLAYDQRKKVYTSLYQTHLETMADAGIVDYDRRSGDVVLTDAVEACDVHLAVADGEQAHDEGGIMTEPWTVAYVAIAVANVLVVYTVWASSAAVPTGPLGAATAGLAILLVAVAAYRLWFSR